MAIAAEVPQPEKQPSVKVKGVCERCGKVATKHSRKGYTWRCDCGFVNMGPGYHAQDRTPPEGTRRRIARRELAAERRAEREQASETQAKPAAAPVRRRRPSVTSPAPAGSAVGAASEDRPGVAPQEAERRASSTGPKGGDHNPGTSPPRRGLFDRLMYGDG